MVHGSLMALMAFMALIVMVMVMMAGGGIGYWYLELGGTCTSSSTS